MAAILADNLLYIDMDGIFPSSSLRGNNLSREWHKWVRACGDYLLAINVIDNTPPVERRKLAMFRHVGGEDVFVVYSLMELQVQRIRLM